MIGNKIAYGITEVSEGSPKNHSVKIYMYIYIYIIIIIICKSFHYFFINYISTIKCCYRFTNSFFTNFDFSLLQEWKYLYKKVDKKTVATKLGETELTVTNHII